MSVHQTSQLIQLILNSALMITVCVGLLGGLWLRHGAIANQLRAHKSQILKLSNPSSGAVPEQLTQLRQDRCHLQRRYHLIHGSTLVIHYTLLVFIASLFTLALRTLVNLSWLIPIALFLFIVGAGGVLVSVALALLEIHQGGQLSFKQSERTPNLNRAARTARTRRRPNPQLPSPAPRSTIPSEPSLKTRAV
ncbi:MAG: DUF2721 domain-containing protein [Leptolyngbyaceae cyanobacterium MO_188.B28]|nr:DUF2721 domain-containing protein [Leptolyngbyaceae cyanobacterium MO_188.B28]